MSTEADRSNDSPPPGQRYRRYGPWLVLLAATVQLIRILTVESSTGEMPFLSANDRSRWCTILALVVSGSYEIDDIIEIRDPETRRRTWYTIDLVQHRGADGRQHFYSSKPPLLPTLYAGVYWLVRGLTGATLTSQPFVVVRIMLVLVNLLPLMGLWWLLLRWADQTWVDDWQWFVLAIFATGGTFLSTFANTLNNHLPAAVAVGVSLTCLHRVLLAGDRRWRWFVGCGLATSFAAANELPALSWVAAAGGLLGLVDWRKSLWGYLPSLLPVAIAFFGTNYLAHGTLRPAYSMRHLGPIITQVPLPPSGQLAQLDPAVVAQSLRPLGYELSPLAEIRPARRSAVWELWDESSQWRLGLKLDDGGQGVGIHQWEDWYDFPGSYWVDGRKQGVDRGEPDRLKYAFHSLVGHHGIFSLTPFWLLGLVGCGLAILGRPAVAWRCLPARGQADAGHWSRLIGLAIAVTSLVVIAFYLSRPTEDRNYGGVTSGLRWIFWLAPLWYWLTIRGVSVAHRRWARWVVVGLLAISLFSANYPWRNPWTTPWLTRWIPLSDPDTPATVASACPKLPTRRAGEVERTVSPTRIVREPA